MHYADLREFLGKLEALGGLKRIAAPVSPRLEMTEICDRVLRAGGPALLFERPAGHAMPVLGNLFGTVERIGLAMGVEEGANEMRIVGQQAQELVTRERERFGRRRGRRRGGAW